MTVCHAADNWEELSSALSSCDRDLTRDVLLKKGTKELSWAEDPGHPWMHPTGFNYKGVDMVMLDQGCPTVVPDKHLIELMEGRPLRARILSEVTEYGFRKRSL